MTMIMTMTSLEIAHPSRMIQLKVPQALPSPLGIFLLHGILVLLVGGSGVLVWAEQTLLDELVGRRAVGDLLVQRVGTHMFLELLVFKRRKDQ